MADLRIVDAPLLSTVKGTEKLPTGGEGNFSVSIDQVADFAKLKWFLATEGYVDNAVGGVQTNLNLHKNNTNNPHQVTKDQVGLANVNNTADLDKPVSNATQSAIITANSGKADKSYVDSQDQLKADKTTVESSLLLKADKVDLVASKILSDGNQNQQEINDSGGAKWYAKSGGYKLGATVKLDNGDTVKSTIPSNTNNPNLDMTGWIKPLSLNILAFGLKANGTDETELFQFTYDKASEMGFDLDLQGLSFKINKLDINNNSTIKNGSLDLTGYVAPSGWEGNWRRAAFMSKTTPRNSSIDYEYDDQYKNLEWFENTTFKDLKIKAIWAVTNFYKARNIKFIGCKFQTTNAACIQFIGGWAGTILPNDTSSSFNIVYDTKNPRCKSIQVTDCEGVYTGEITDTVLNYSSLVRTIACDDVSIQNCKTEDMSIPIHADIYNKNVKVHGGEYKMTDRAKIYLENNETADGDFLGVYIGQNSFDYSIRGVAMKNVFRPVYLEGASQVDIFDNNVFENEFNFVSDSFGILIQANHRDNTGEKWANCADVMVDGNRITGYDTPVAVQPAPTSEIITYKNIDILDNNLKASGSLPSLVLSKIDGVNVRKNDMNSAIQLSNISKHDISKNTVNAKENYALYVASTRPSFPLKLTNNELRVDSGDLIYKAEGTEKLSLIGGNLKYSTFAPASSSNIEASNFILESIELIKTATVPLLALASGGLRVINIDYNGLPSGSPVNISMQSESTYKQTPYGWDFEYSASCIANNKVQLIFKNRGASIPEFTAVFFIAATPNIAI